MTAPTPEELAARIELVGTEAAQEEIREDIAAAIRQHSEDQRAEIERLERDLGTLRTVTSIADSAAEARATTAEAALAASQERERVMREALTVAANRLARCAIDHPAGSREMSERNEWAEEARAAGPLEDKP